MKLPGAIIFDSDGVLVDSETIHVEAELAMLSAYGLDMPPAEYMSLYVGMRETDWIRGIVGEFASRELPFDAREFSTRLEAIINERIEAELTAVPDVDAVLAAHHGPVAVASSAAPKDLRRKLEITGLLEKFLPHVYSGWEVEHGKPAPDLFLHAAARLQVEPDVCLVIEDSVNGVRAGRAAGMIVLGFTGGGHADPDLATRLRAAGAHDVVPSHAEIAARISAGALLAT